MNRAHYIIFHPDSARQEAPVTAQVIVNSQVYKNWTGKIWVDEMFKGNEDPFVFNDPWLFSYCHATQLRRQMRSASYLHQGSILIFCSGDEADRDNLVVDTVFVINKYCEWDRTNILKLPSEYFHLYSNRNHPLWKRHFKFPVSGKLENRYHTSVTHTYEATNYDTNGSLYSYLPLDKNGERFCLPFKSLDKSLVLKIKKKRKGKIPTLIEELDVHRLYKNLGKSPIKVIGQIELIDKINAKDKESVCSPC